MSSQRSSSTRTGHARLHSVTGQQHSPLLQCAELQAALLGNTAIGQDQEVLPRLLQTNKGLRTELACHCVGQMTAVLCIRHTGHAVAFASWLQRHAGLLQGLELQLPDKVFENLSTKHAVGVLAGLISEQQQHMQGLQRFTLKSSCWAAGILQQLPASLSVLDLSGMNAPAVGGAHSWAPITRLQQLTELRLGQVLPSQLSTLELPPLLQQLDVTVEVRSDKEALLSLGQWLQLHGRIVRHLALSNMCSLMDTSCRGVDREAKEWNAAMEAVATGLKCAAAPLAEAASAALNKAGQHITDSTADATAALHNAGTAPPSSWRMQTLYCHHSSTERRPLIPVPGVLLQQLPAVTLTRLVCALEFDQPQHLAALCGLTALRSLDVLPLFSVTGSLGHVDDECSNIFSPMSALRQLTALKLKDTVPVQQLAHLQLPQLQRLEVRIQRCARRHNVGDDAEEQEQQQQQQKNKKQGGFKRATKQVPQLQLGQLVSLTYLVWSGCGLKSLDELPVSLRVMSKSYNDHHHHVTI